MYPLSELYYTNVLYYTYDCLLHDYTLQILNHKKLKRFEIIDNQINCLLQL